jgi:thermopsin
MGDGLGVRTKNLGARLGAILIVGILTITCLGMTSVSLGNTHPPRASMASSVSLSPSVANSTTSVAAAALAATRAAGLSPDVVYLPRPAATAEEIALAKESGVISPVYHASPAPMGLAYYGLSAGADRNVVGTILNTTGLIGIVNFNATGVLPVDLVQSTPDAFSIQLNAVLTNVTLFGISGYSFWTQNVAEYEPAEKVLSLITNVWNFSGPITVLNNSVIYAHGPNGTNQANELGYYYASAQLPEPISYPFNLTLTLNSTVTDGRNAVDFGARLYSATDPSEDFATPFDYVIFNSTAPGGSAITVPSNYTANGLAYNRADITNDFELEFGGPGGGSQATLFAADATLGLGYWIGGGYRAVPSAYTYGGEAAETVTGANVAWSNATGARPYPGLVNYGTMTTGPSILTGLWNATGPEGSYRVTLNVQPKNAFNIFAALPPGRYGGSERWTANFTDFGASIVPEMFTNVVYMMPGFYTLRTELSDYAPFTMTMYIAVPETITVNLVLRSSLGIYTPLWAFSNAEIADLSVSGSGTTTSPYVIENAQHTTLGPIFGLFNDAGYPVYPAVFFYGTTATTILDRPPSFATTTNTSQFLTFVFPETNDLQYWFYNVSNVALLNAANISGWFGSYVLLFFPSFDPFSVIFYEGGHNLVAANTFRSEGDGLLLFSGGTGFGPLNVGGGNITVWGNRFYATAPPPPSMVWAYLWCSPYTEYPLLCGLEVGLAMEIAESNDLIYNNYVDTPTTASLLTMNLDSGASERFNDAFNITLRPASDVHYAAGFPFEPLTGSIIKTSYQGGNYWWDYGVIYNPYNGADNPYGVLPYRENTTSATGLAPDIYPGGDYAPLVPARFYPITFRERNLPGLLSWTVVACAVGPIYGIPAPVAIQSGLAGSNLEFSLPNGTFHYYAYPGPFGAGSDPAGWTYSGAPFVAFKVTGKAAIVTVTYGIARGYHVLRFDETGLPRGRTWIVTINGTNNATYAFNATESTTGTALNFAVSAGTYTYSVAPISGFTVPGPGSLNISGSRIVTLRFHQLLKFPTGAE